MTLASARILAALALLVGAWFHGHHVGQQGVRADWEAERTALAQQHARDVQHARQTERQTALKIQEALDAEHQARQAAQRDAAAARDAVRSLRQQAADFAARRVPGDSAPAASGPPANDDRAGVLADLLGRAAERAERLAEQADTARIAGQACERSYEAVRQATNQLDNPAQLP